MRRATTTCLCYPVLPSGCVSLEIVHAISSYGTSFKAGQQGRLTSGYGTGLYNFHVEVPFDGVGVPIESVVVVEIGDDGSVIRTPYIAWCRRQRLVVLCPTCHSDITSPDTLDCAAARPVGH